MATKQKDVNSFYKAYFQEIRDRFGHDSLSTDEINKWVEEQGSAKPGRSWLLDLAIRLGWRDKHNDKGKRARFSSVQSALLLACFELKNEGGNFSDIVNEARAFYKKIDKPNLWDTQTQIGVSRAERIIIPRILGYVVSQLGSIDKLSQDCYIIVEYIKYRRSAPARPIIISAVELAQNIKRDLAQNCDCTWATTGENGEVYLIGKPEDYELDNRSYVRLEFMVGQQCVVLNIGPCSYDPSYRKILIAIRDRAMNICNNPEGSASEPFVQLLKAAAVHWPEVKADLVKLTAPEGQTNLIFTQIPNLMLLSLNRLIAKVISEETGLRCFCDMLVHKSDDADGKDVLRIWASSSSEPWNLRAIQEELKPGQFLSGAVFLANCGAMVEDVKGTQKGLISFWDREKVNGAISLPTLNPDTAQPNGSIYIGLFYDNLTNDQKERALNLIKQHYFSIQILGLCAGEIIQREKLAIKTLETSTALSKYVVLDEKEFCIKVKDALGKLDIPASSHPSTLRLAFVLFSALSDIDSEASQETAYWLEKQLAFLNIEGSLLHFLTTTGISRDDILVGLIGKRPMLAVLIPHFLGKKEIRLLREIPTEINSLLPLTMERDGVKVRIGAWVYDFSCKCIQEMIDESKEATSQVMISKLIQWAKVASFVIRTYEYTHWNMDTKRADWKRAIEEAKRGLEIDNKNPYLLRRAAECALVLGNLKAAEDFARRSFVADPEHVRSGCLVGDIELAGANINEALRQYSEVIQIDTLHPLPYYSAAFALMTVAKVVRDWIIGSLRQSYNKDAMKQFHQYVTETDRILVLARNLFEKAASKLVIWDYEAERGYMGHLYDPVNSASKAEAALLCGDLETAMPDFIGAREKYPTDENLNRGLIRAILTHTGKAKTMATKLTEIIETSEKMLAQPTEQ